MASAPVSADDDDSDDRGKKLFRPTATFDVIDGNGSAVAEIVDATRNGRQLVYTDADNMQIGFVNIRDPYNPVGQGTVNLDGEPTSLVIRGRHVLVAVNTSPDFVNPSGKLVVIDRRTRAIVTEIDLGGQPDSIALAPDRRRAVVAIENERDESLNGGLITPAQLPAGEVLIIELSGPPAGWTPFAADLSDVIVNAFAGNDLEPEFIDINRQNEAVVTFQENNHIAVIDIVTGDTISEFSAGEVDLMNVDTVENSLIELNTDIPRRREPDAVAWIDDDHFATANEGDYEDENGVEGGSRGFTVFNQGGGVMYESFESFEHLLISAGHFNEGRADAKGVEPEATEVGKYGNHNLLFVASERANAVGVYDANDPAAPSLLQVLPTGIGPEGLKAITRRGLFVASTEKDEAGDGIPTMINIYKMKRGSAYYPMIMSDLDNDGLPIPWVALSDLVGDPWDEDTLYTVNDSFLAAGFIYTVDVSEKTAIIVDRLEVTGASADLDLEGIAVAEDGHFWLGSEGNTGSRPNLVLKVDPLTGFVLDEFELPAALVDMRRGNGIEGIAVTGPAGAETVYVAIQRAWPDEGDTDKVNTKIGRLDVSSGQWEFVHYPLEPEGNGDWIGLSSLTLLPDGTFAVIERDKGWGETTPPNAELKALFTVDLASADFQPYMQGQDNLTTISKTPLYDVLPDIADKSIWTAEKLEGFAVAADGETYVVTDNDGVDDAPGETIFLHLGDIDDLLDEGDEDEDDAEDEDEDDEGEDDEDEDDEDDDDSDD